MSDTIKVDPNELRASAAAARTIGSEFEQPASRVPAASRTAAGELTGWSLASALGNLADEWAPSLAKATERITTTATNLDATAQGHEWNDQQIAETWQQQGGR